MHLSVSWFRINFTNARQSVTQEKQSMIHVGLQFLNGPYFKMQSV